MHKLYDRMKKSLVRLLVTLCLFAISGNHVSGQGTLDTSTNYEQQYIAVMENQPDLMEAAQFLFRKHPAVSNIVVWDGNQGRFFLYDTNNQAVSNHVIDNLNEKGLRIQVVGHGQVDRSSGSPKIKMSGLTGTELSNAITTLLDVPSDTTKTMTVKKISLAGCKLAPDPKKRARPENRARETFLRELCEQFHSNRVRTSVNARSELIGISPSGQKMVGKQGTENVEWISKEGFKPGYKYRAYVQPDGTFVLANKAENPKYTNDPNLKNDQDMETGILSELVHQKGSLLHMLDPSKTVLKSQWLKADVAYKLLDEVSKKLYVDIDSTTPVPVDKVIVRHYNDETLDHTYWTRDVQQITGSADDFMAELKRRAEAYQRDDSNPPQKGSDKLYYRYGDWIFGMRKDTFYINLEGVVASEHVPNGYESQDTKHDRSALKRALERDGYRLENEQVAMETVPEAYPNMRPGLSNSFMQRAKSWINGQRAGLDLPTDRVEQIKQCYDGQMAIAMFFSESIRNFRTHVTNVMGLDLAENKFVSLDEFYAKHPMARTGTWQETTPAVSGGYRKKVGVEPDGLRSDLDGKPLPNPPRERLVESTGTWMGRVKTSCDENGNFIPDGTYEMMGSFYKQGWPDASIVEIDHGGVFYEQMFDNLYRRMNLQGRNGEYSRWHTKLESDFPTEDVETVATTNGVEFDREFDDIIAPTKFSSYLAIDQDFVNNKIDAELQEIKDQFPDKEVEIDLGSIEVKDNEVSFDVVYDKSAYPPSEGRVQKKVSIEEEELLSKNKLDEFHERCKTLNEGGALQEVNKGLSIYGTVMGLKGSIQALQRGDIPNGMVALSQSLHGIGELTGINRKVYSAGKKLLGNVLDKGVKSLENTVLEGLSSEVKSGISQFGELIEDVPIVGTAFGIYNIMQDFQQGTTLGYIDAGLDTAITGLSFLGPEADIVTVPLTIIRMSIDELFGNIHINKSLPLDAQIRQFFEQFGQGILNWFETFSPIVNIINTVIECKKLDAEYDKEQDFLHELEDYHNYYDIVNDGSTIDFTDGIDAQFGGSIVFHLEENGNAQFSYVADIIDGVPQRETRHITMDPSVKDIVLGMGETLKITTKEENVKLFGIITVDSHRIINDTIPDKKSLHGTYHGNYQDNYFYCVQDQPPDLPYNLTEYHYEVYGHAGDDKFMLGPQHTYVEGGAGSDTIYIHARGSLVTINNYAKDGATDYGALYAKYDELDFLRDDLDMVIHIRSESAFALLSRHSAFTSAFREMFGVADMTRDIEGVTHIVRIQNWFKDVTYQHMHFSTTDGVSFRMTVDKQGHPQTAILSLDLSSKQEGQTVEDLPFCSAVVGSDYVDTITGNKLNNHIEGGKGNDIIKGLDGVDMYVIREGDGIDTLDNYATDNETDMLFLLTSHSSLSASTSGDDLVIDSSSGNTGVKIKKWFSGDPHYLHLGLVDKDGVVLQIPSSRSDLQLKVLYLDTSLTSNVNPDLTDKDLQDVTDVNLAEYWHTVIGNSQDNTIYAQQGSNSINGNFGSNTYVLGEEGVHTNVHMSEDQQLIMINVKGEITAEFGNDVQLTKDMTKEKFATLHAKHSMTAKIFNITQIRSYGVVLRLDLDPSYRASVVPIMVDFSSGDMWWPLSSVHDNEIYDIDMTLTDAPRLIGPPIFVKIRCHDNGLYIDPGEKGSFILTGYGTNTFVYKSNYGTNNVIRIIDYSSKVNTLLFLVPYNDISLTTDDSDSTLYKIIISSETADLRVEFQVLKQYLVINLLVLSSDGITAELRGSSYDPEGYYLAPTQINRAKDEGQTLNLTAVEEWETVVGVYGSTAHSNHLTGNDNNNTLVGGDLDDTLMGMEGDDILKGGGGDDHMYGGYGDDMLLAGKGNDYLYGDNDSDVFIVPISGNHHVDGGNGSDTVVCVTQAGCTASLTDKLMYASDKPGGHRVTLNDIENIEGTPHGDSLEGDDSDNTLNGLAGDDLLNPMIGADSLTGGEGSDTYYLVAGESGFSSINNFAEDRKRDVITVVIQNQTMNSEMCVKERWKDLFMRKRVSDNLIIRWLSIDNPVYFDNFYMPRISLHNWFKGQDYQHLCLEFCGLNLCNGDLTPEG